MSATTIREARARRKRRIRGRIHGTTERPRVAVFRSNKAIYAQLVDDAAAATLVAARSAEVDGSGLKKADVAKKVGELLAQSQGSRRGRPRGRPGFLTRRIGPRG